MTSNEFISIEEAVERYGIPKEKILNKVLQKAIHMENCEGYVGLSVHDLDTIYVNDKVRHTGASKIKIGATLLSSREPFTAEEDAALIKYYWIESLDALQKRLPTRTEGSISGRTSRLKDAKKIPRCPPGYTRTRIVSRQYGVCQSTVSDTALRGDIRAIRRGGVWYVHIKDCESRWGRKRKPTDAADLNRQPIAKDPLPPPDAEHYVDAKTAGRRIGTSKVYVTEACRRGTVPGAYIGRGTQGKNQWFVPEAWVENREKQIAPPPTAPPLPAPRDLERELEESLAGKAFAVKVAEEARDEIRSLAEARDALAGRVEDLEILMQNADAIFTTLKGERDALAQLVIDLGKGGAMIQEELESLRKEDLDLRLKLTKIERERNEQANEMRLLKRSLADAITRAEVAEKLAAERERHIDLLTDRLGEAEAKASNTEVTRTGFGSSLRALLKGAA